jgi:release factor glutamine methyltransferase
MLPGNYLRQSEWLTQAKLKLANAGIENSKVDADYLLSYITHIPRLELLLHSNEVLTSRQLLKIEKLLLKRINREPLQYIIKSVEFYRLLLHINRNVLIPRPETEYLVDMIIRENSKVKSILDIGTGSGAIALALKHAFPKATVLGTDISLPALRMAIANARRLNIHATFRKSNVYEKIKGHFDVIVSNPPYLTENEYNNSQPEIKNFEPKQALQADDNGLQIYDKILGQAVEYLNPGGKVYFEIGYQQAEQISFLAQKNGFTSMEKRKDLNGFDRYFIIRT